VIDDTKIAEAEGLQATPRRDRVPTKPGNSMKLKAALSAKDCSAARA
jgi:hypothetical protein